MIELVQLSSGPPRSWAAFEVGRVASLREAPHGWVPSCFFDHNGPESTFAPGKSRASVDGANPASGHIGLVDRHLPVLNGEVMASRQPWASEQADSAGRRSTGMTAGRGKSRTLGALRSARACREEGPGRLHGIQAWVGLPRGSMRRSSPAVRSLLVGATLPRGTSRGGPACGAASWVAGRGRSAAKAAVRTHSARCVLMSTGGSPRGQRHAQLDAQ